MSEKEIKTTQKETAPPEAMDKFTAQDFQKLMKHHEHSKTAALEEAQRKTAEQQKQKVKELINHHIDDAGWQSMLHHAHDAAGQGAKELMLLRFPNELCSDGGRAVNVGDAEWPSTLRGEAEEIYQRWEKDLKPQGFRLSARTLEYPGGFPGDIGLFLVWG